MVKLDENVPAGLVTDFAASGHDAVTVVGQGAWEAPPTQRSGKPCRKKVGS